MLIVQGVIKYMDNIRLSSFPETHKHYMSMYLSNVYKQSERQINKYLGKMNWFADKEEDGREWRSKLCGVWSGAK